MWLLNEIAKSFLWGMSIFAVLALLYGLAVWLNIHQIPFN
jgi:hypothetical protein